MGRGRQTGQRAPSHPPRRLPGHEPRHLRRVQPDGKPPPARRQRRHRRRQLGHVEHGVRAQRLRERGRLAPRRRLPLLLHGGRRHTKRVQGGGSARVAARACMAPGRGPRPPPQAARAGRSTPPLRACRCGGPPTARRGHRRAEAASRRPFTCRRLRLLRVCPPCVALLLQLRLERPSLRLSALRRLHRAGRLDLLHLGLRVQQQRLHLWSSKSKRQLAVQAVRPEASGPSHGASLQSPRCSGRPSGCRSGRRSLPMVHRQADGAGWSDGPADGFRAPAAPPGCPRADGGRAPRASPSGCSPSS